MKVGAVNVNTARQREHHLFVAWAILIVSIVFAGFARTYYLRGVFGSPALDGFLHFHGAVMSAWVGLLLIQVVLIATKHLDWHRRLGKVGITVAILVSIMGTAATLRAAAREVAAHSEFVEQQLLILALELTQIAMFAIFFSMAIWQVKRPANHKRLILLATLCILPNPIVRIVVNFHVDSMLIFLWIWIVVVVSAVLIDGWRRAEVQRYFAWCASAAIALLYLAYYIGKSETWLRLSAQWVS